MTTDRFAEPRAGGRVREPGVQVPAAPPLTRFLSLEAVRRLHPAAAAVYRLPSATDRVARDHLADALGVPRPSLPRLLLGLLHRIHDHDPVGCWPWASGDPSARLVAGGRTVPVSRVAYVLLHGEAPPLHLSPTCGTARCLQPAHLRRPAP